MSHLGLQPWPQPFPYLLGLASSQTPWWLWVFSSSGGAQNQVLFLGETRQSEAWGVFSPPPFSLPHCPQPGLGSPSLYPAIAPRSLASPGPAGRGLAESGVSLGRLKVTAPPHSGARGSWAHPRGSRPLGGPEREALLAAGVSPGPVLPVFLPPSLPLQQTRSCRDWGRGRAAEGLAPVAGNRKPVLSQTSP